MDDEEQLTELEEEPQAACICEEGAIIELVDEEAPEPVRPPKRRKCCANC